ncbi:hypothetical protein [uncultured Xanthomonas sp.]|uniref:hypothetical protein n=1 Tax=uncultured Xanthomonas sp. TaxID=152831 RepID=UPI0025EBEC16|nr:hypothetical protein [uncultured Xanthomonas sp.]
MPTNPCLNFFEENRGNKDKVKALIATGAGDGWYENGLTASPWSPGAVDLEEEIARQVHSPLHWDEELRQIKLGFFDDLTGQGLSVNRLAHTNLERLAIVSRERAEKRGREAIGFVVARVTQLIEVMRAIQDGSGAVFDTANEDDISHADVCQTKGAKAVGRAMRQDLFEALKGNFSPYRLESEA